MNYNEALNYIHGTRKFGSKLGLDNIKVLLDFLGNPQRALKVIHIAGTNGKGSTASFISSVLQEEGYKVGLFTSPYLEEFTERIRINGIYIPKETLATMTVEVKKKVEIMIEKGYNHPTEFEIVTAIAFLYYRDENVDFVTLEVGLGGRYDSTNVIEDSIVSVITPISIDHKDILGDTLSKIAWEKAGIIKEQGFVISAPQEEEAKNVLQETVKEKDGQITFIQDDSVIITSQGSFGSTFDFEYRKTRFKNLEIALLGKHQVSNAALALTTLLTLRNKGLIHLLDTSIVKGLKKTKWKGRLEILRQKPTFIIDGAHNHKGAQTLKEAIKSLFQYRKLILGIGILADKEVASILSEIIPLADLVLVTEANGPRILKAEVLNSFIKSYHKRTIVEPDLEKAVKKSLELAQEDDLIIFSGSLYLIGDVRRIMLHS